MTERGLEQLKRHEGFRAKPYRDTVGKLTIGYGRNLDDVGINATEADVMLTHDLIAARDELDRHLPWWRYLSLVRRDVMVNLMYNMGWGGGRRGLSTFRNTLKAIRAGRYEEAARGLLASKWARQVKGRAVELAAQMAVGRFVTIKEAEEITAGLGGMEALHARHPE